MRYILAGHGMSCADLAGHRPAISDLAKVGVAGSNPVVRSRSELGFPAARPSPGSQFGSQSPRRWPRTQKRSEQLLAEFRFSMFWGSPCLNPSKFDGEGKL